MDCMRCCPGRTRRTSTSCSPTMSTSGTSRESFLSRCFRGKWCKSATVNRLYAMLSRQDSENIYIMFSDNVHFWYEPRILLKPVFPWEMVQIGNCGSPIETKAGWLVLSHGVGPVREYSIGAFLLDLDDPSKVIGRLREPLLKPILSEWEGNVPNVTYSCGALLHDGELFIPYGVSDYATRFATVQLNEVLAAMQ